MVKEQTKTYQLSLPTFILKTLYEEFKEEVGEIDNFIYIKEREETLNLEEIKTNKHIKKFLLKFTKDINDNPNKDIPYYTTYLTKEEILLLGKETKKRMYPAHYILDFFFESGKFNEEGEWEVHDEEWYNQNVDQQMRILRSLNILNHLIYEVHMDYKELGNYNLQGYDLIKELKD